MRKYLVADATLETHPTAKSVAKVLKVKLLCENDNTELSFTSDLYGYEKPDQFMWSPPPANNVGGKVLGEIAADLVERIGKDGVLDWQVSDLPARIADFELSWKKKAFSNALRAYGVMNRLTFEQALLVLREHYIVEPIMES